MARTDNGLGAASNPDAPYSDAFSIAPDNDATLAELPRGIYVGGAGDLVVSFAGRDVTFKAVPVGTTLRIRPSKVLATGTTATHLLALL